MRFSLLVCATLIGVVTAEASERFDAYWNQGKAELTRYALTQSRYGEQHEGDAVLVFVTEPFSRAKQVKLDDWANAGNDRVEVLKLNFTKNFLTGIYPYALMLSVFTPIDTTTDSRTLKTTMSGQEWCGQVFSQLNLRNDRYHLRSFSYFESEGDEDRTVPAVFIEDEIWTRLRLNPQTVPTGKFSLLPGSFATRLLHQKFAPRSATGRFFTPSASDHVLSKRFGDIPLRGYQLAYTEGDKRRLTLYFEPGYPHRIAGWDETWIPAGDSTRTATQATRTATLLTPYWNQHDNVDRPLRAKLDLSTER